MVTPSANTGSDAAHDTDSETPTDAELVYAGHWSRADDTPPSECVAAALAEVVGRPPTRLELRLYDYVEPDALDALLTDETADQSGVSITFSIGRYRVRIAGDGTLTVTA
ncbi:HalOD1 output domain-containing protein [Haladaptatus sp. NG-WS-4]